MQVRKQLQDLRQGPNESMYDYLEKFNHLEHSCCNLGLPEKLIIEYLLEGRRPLDNMLLDASAGGTIMNLPLGRIRKLIADVAENARFREETTQKDQECCKGRHPSEPNDRRAKADEGDDAADHKETTGPGEAV
ncbi:unnamed protein product [Rhodiola kirilowii]